jgi:phosphoglycolate phosphatase
MSARAIIFDFDGTLADTIPAIAEGVNLAMEKYGFPTHSRAAVESFINNGPRMLIRRALPKEKQEDEALLDRILADYTTLYETVCMHTDRAYDGLYELLLTLRSKGYRIGVLSNKQDHLVRTLCQRIFPDLCDAVAGTTPGNPTKPDPALTLRMTEQLGVSPEECILVGDSDVDLHTAQNAGMRHIGVTWGYRSREALIKAGAVELADTAEELLSLIESTEN